MYPLEELSDRALATILDRHARILDCGDFEKWGQAAAACREVSRRLWNDAELETALTLEQ